MSTTVRVHERTRDAIARLSNRRGQSAAELLDDLIGREEEDELLAGMNEAYEELRRNRKTWTAERDERATWETTLLDGLADL